MWNDITAIDDKRIVVFNTLRRTAILMDACEYAAEIESMPPKTVEMLTGLGMIVDAGFDERAEVERRFDDGKRDMSYIDLTVLLTHDCQLGCTYCFEGAKSRKYIDDGTAHEILRFLESMKPVCRRLRVTWFGGEPLMAYAQLKRLSMALISFCKRQWHRLSCRHDHQRVCPVALAMQGVGGRVGRETVHNHHRWAGSHAQPPSSAHRRAAHFCPHHGKCGTIGQLRRTSDAAHDNRPRKLHLIYRSCSMK